MVVFWNTYKRNNIEKTQIIIHVLNNKEVNAFVLPNGHLVLYSGLIVAAENQEELSGVICHELAHIELNHVVKKLIKEVGLSVLISMTTGGGTDIIKETAKMLSTTAFDRSMEKKADIKAVEYLVKANINPESILSQATWELLKEKITTTSLTYY